MLSVFEYNEMRYLLKPDYQDMLDEFFAFVQEHGGCRCWICAPCSYCTHPGHPISLEQIDEAWLDPLTAAVRDVVERGKELKE